MAFDGAFTDRLVEETGYQQKSILSTDIVGSGWFEYNENIH